MAVARITLSSVGYPNTAPNSVMVLQSLMEAGFDIILRDAYYKDRQVIIDYFTDRNISVSFRNVGTVDIDVLATTATVGEDVVDGASSSIWEAVDKICLGRQIYERNPLDEYIPSYEDGTYFIVLDYGLPSQLVDSVPISLKGTHTKGGKIAKNKPSIQSIDVVNSTTWEIVEQYNKDTTAFEPVEYETLYYSIFV